MRMFIELSRKRRSQPFDLLRDGGHLGVVAASGKLAQPRLHRHQLARPDRQTDPAWRPARAGSKRCPACRSCGGRRRRARVLFESPRRHLGVRRDRSRVSGQPRRIRDRLDAQLAHVFDKDEDVANRLPARRRGQYPSPSRRSSARDRVRRAAEPRPCGPDRKLAQLAQFAQAAAADWRRSASDPARARNGCASSASVRRHASARSGAGLASSLPARRGSPPMPASLRTLDEDAGAGCRIGWRRAWRALFEHGANLVECGQRQVDQLGARPPAARCAPGRMRFRDRG